MKIQFVAVRIRLSKREAIGLIAAALLSLPCGYLVSETLTLSTSYPSPMGIYKTIVTTDATTLARNSGDVLLAGGGGKVGVGTANPQATLDVAGTIRHSLYASAPFACNAAHDGAIGATAAHNLCICNSGGAGWVYINDGATACNWTAPPPAP